MKQTAVEWLFDNLNITGGSDDMKAFEKAKAMEKEQIIDAFNNGYINSLKRKYTTTEQYYNKTFKNK